VTKARPTPRRIAVIGAGAAGAMAARVLTDHGHAVHVFEKSRGAGGRMATRRSGALAFDHGAQYLTLRDPRMLARRDDWLRAGVLAPWQQAADAAQVRWVAVPGMNALARHLLAGIEVTWAAPVSAVERVAAGWRLHAGAAGRVAGFDALIVAIPAPQAAALLASLSPWSALLAEVEMAPCWALMLAGAKGLPRDLPQDLLTGSAAAGDPAAALAWLACEASKPGRLATADAWVLHATDAWSRAHLEADPGVVAAELWCALAARLGLPAAPPPSHLVAHRWRYARAGKPLAVPSLWDAGLALGLCGDWCLGARVEAALLSGADVAHRLIDGL
jgi:predicted NAD/FAD-dependent oxidoreductase